MGISRFLKFRRATLPKTCPFQHPSLACRIRGSMQTLSTKILPRWHHTAHLQIITQAEASKLPSSSHHPTTHWAATELLFLRLCFIICDPRYITTAQRIMCPHANDSIQKRRPTKYTCTSSDYVCIAHHILLCFCNLSQTTIAAMFCDQVIMLIHETDLIARACHSCTWCGNDDGWFFLKA